jgi:two-component system, chemotaxis family, CheB/CheR fusion protein
MQQDLEDRLLDDIIMNVRANVGTDLRAYRRSTLERRITSRMHKVHCHTIDEYICYLQSQPRESRLLAEHIMIKVSRFFRDTSVYAMLRSSVLPDFQRRSAAGETTRVWSAGCGCGEEPYSIAMMLNDEVEDSQGSFEITGTDIDESALAEARNGLYKPSSLEQVPAEIHDRYFTVLEGRFGPHYQLSADVRSLVQFRHHDLLDGEKWPAGSQYNLVLCRNVLIYFERPAQDQVLRNLAASIAPHGYLCLGEAEQLPNNLAVEFTTIDRQARLYRRDNP